ncbi:hypothetical protein Shyhy02_66160 [Streptomyces hygroscopicus subsp. hygroscopicus]|nr:hypothetical protein Shyhy02_66160 [Streptomyces hygroscopicus subsp. hygroscopicus]
MKRVRLHSALEKPLQSLAPEPYLRRRAAVVVACGSAGLLIGMLADAEAGAQAALALAALWGRTSGWAPERLQCCNEAHQSTQAQSAGISSLPPADQLSKARPTIEREEQPGSGQADATSRLQ